jgi:peptidylprolyl isomerase
MKIRKSGLSGPAVSRIFVACSCAAFLALPVRADEKTAPAAPAAAAEKKESKMKTTPSGLQYEDTKEGAGASPKTGQTCVMHYTGWLWEKGAKGKKFDSSLDRGQPFEFPIGQGRVIKGWDEGVATMKIGGKRTLLIPPALGYGARGAGGVIPPNATLLFEVELLGVK